MKPVKFKSIASMVRAMRKGEVGSKCCQAPYVLKDVRLDGVPAEGVVTMHDRKCCS